MPDFSIVSFITEYGDNSPYSAVIKGTIWKKHPNLQMVDITQKVKPNDILCASYLMKTAGVNFPDQTIHLVGVDFNPDKYSQVLVTRYQGGYVVGADNGIFSMLFENENQEVFQIKGVDAYAGHPFPEAELFPFAVDQLLTQGIHESWTAPSEIKTIRKLLTPQIDDNKIRGSILFIDGYQNAVTDITRSDFEQLANRWSKFEIFYRRNSGITRISEGYSQEKPGEVIALFNHFGYLELAIRDGKAHGLLGIDVGKPIMIEFHD